MHRTYLGLRDFEAAFYDIVWGKNGEKVKKETEKKTLTSFHSFLDTQPSTQRNMKYWGVFWFLFFFL